MNPIENTNQSSHVGIIEVPVRLRLQNYIKSKGYVLRVIAERSGIGEKKFYKILDGSCRLTADDLEKICARGLSVDPAYFFEKNFSELEK